MTQPTRARACWICMESPSAGYDVRLRPASAGFHDISDSGRRHLQRRRPTRCAALLRAAAPSGSCRSPPTSHRRRSARGAMRARLRLRKRRAMSLADRAQLRGRARESSTPSTFGGIALASVPGRSEYGKTCRCVSGSCSQQRARLVEVRVGLPGKADDDVGADRRRAACARGCARRGRGRTSAVYGRRIARRIVVGAVLQRQMEVRRQARRRRRPASTISGVQSIGSSELMRNSTSSAQSASARTSAVSDDAVGQVAAVRAEVHAGDRDLLVAGGDRARDVVERPRPADCERPAPRVVGMMQ